MDENGKSHPKYDAVKKVTRTLEFTAIIHSGYVTRQNTV